MVLAWTLAGCSAARPELTVNLRPPEELGGVEGGRQRELQIQRPFTDAREIHESCGMQKTLGMDAGAVACPGDLLQALPAFLARQLEAAGFRVLSEGVPPRASTVLLEGRLLKFYMEPVDAATVETDVQLLLVASSGSGLRAEREFFEKGRGGTFQRSVNNALRKILEAMAEATVDLLDRYPGLGGAAETVELSGPPGDTE